MKCSLSSRPNRAKAHIEVVSMKPAKMANVRIIIFVSWFCLLGSVFDWVP